jgi:hypothetical protein
LPKAALASASAKGAGASPPPFPQPLHVVQAALQHLVGQPPDHAGLTPPRSRWWLDGIRQAVDWLHGRWLHGRCLATVWLELTQ